MSDQVTQIQHQDLAIARLAAQFKESTNLIGYIRALLEENEALEQVFQDILDSRALDTATGFQLDILGEIVGRDRTFEDAIATPYFGFEGAIGAGSFGSEGDPEVGEVFLSAGADEFVQQILDDDTYRIFLKAKILKNKTKCTINEIIEIALLAINATRVIISEANKSFTVTYVGQLTDTEKLILTRTDYIAKPIGVSVYFADSDGIFN